MSIPVSEVISTARIILQDPNKVRWTDAELVAWLNAALRDVSTLRPDLTAQYREILLVDGYLQALPADCTRIMDMVHNTDPAMTAVIPVSRRVLDLQFPTWASGALNALTKHIIYDERVPRQFMVLPPAIAGNKLFALCGVNTTPVTLVNGAVSETSFVDLPERLMNALIDYVLFRAFSKDAEDANYVERAKAHYDLFKSALAADAEISKAATAAATG